MALELRDVTSRYPGQTDPLLRNLSLSVEKGSFTMLLGSNGAGKSSILSLLTGRLKPESGAAFCDGTEIPALPPRSRAVKIATVFQNTEHLPDFTVGELVMLGRNPYRPRFGAPSAEDCRIVADVLERMALTPFEQRSVLQLSGGERQRVMIAAALARQSDYLLLDEPTAAADPAYRIRLIRILQSLPWHPGILMTTHDIAAASVFASRILMLHGGRILADGPPDSVLTAENLDKLYGREAVFFLNSAIDKVSSGVYGHTDGEKDAER